VAEMKAVILSLCPEATIVDISHQVERFDVRMGAFVLASAAPYFPRGTIHVAVVDPGVGTRRRPILVETGRSLYVGPDNGLLMLSAHREGIVRVYHITNRRYMLPTVSRTFHGRDAFSCAAAHLARGVPPPEFGPAIQDYQTPRFSRPHRRGGRLVGEVVHVDGFGNIITSISEEDLNGIRVREGVFLNVKLKGRDLRLRLCSAYGEAPPGTALAIVGSGDFLEVSVNQGDASREFRAEAGDPVEVSGPA